MAVTAALVKQLRETSGAGMMDCKKALEETNADIDAAIDWLRTKGLATAAKKSGRVASEGLIAIHVNGDSAAMIELNAETDFVSRNDDFKLLASNLARLANKVQNLNELNSLSYPNSKRTVAEEITHNIATIGENMMLRRMKNMRVGRGSVVSYVHNATAEGMGRIGVLVALESQAKSEILEGLGKQIAMHVAASKPASLSVQSLDPAMVQKERDILLEQAKETGKSDDIAKKMVEGRIRKFYQEVVLLEQTFVIDGESKIADVLKKAASECGSEIVLKEFCLFVLGDGIEKEETDFATEVAAQLEK